MRMVVESEHIMCLILRKGIQIPSAVGTSLAQFHMPGGGLAKVMAMLLVMGPLQCTETMQVILAQTTCRIRTSHIFPAHFHATFLTPQPSAAARGRRRCPSRRPDRCRHRNQLGRGHRNLRRHGAFRGASPWYLCLRFREALCHPAARHQAHHPRPRSHRPGPVRYGTYLLLPMHLLRGLMCGGLSAARATYLGCKEEERSEGRRDEDHHKYITFRV